MVVINGMNLEGDEFTKTVATILPPLPEGTDLTGEAAGRKRLSDAGIGVMAFGDMVQLSSISFGSQARRAGWEQGWDVISVKQLNPKRPSDYWVYFPAFFILLFVWLRQGPRLRNEPQPIMQAGQTA